MHNFIFYLYFIFQQSCFCLHEGREHIEFFKKDFFLFFSEKENKNII